jgi:hypothetical protein
MGLQGGPARPAFQDVDLERVALGLGDLPGHVPGEPFVVERPLASHGV